MSYNVHNFQNGQVIEAPPVNEMDLQIQKNEKSIVILEPHATSSDVGKYLKAKTVSGGKVTEYELGEASGGGGGVSDYNDLSNKPQIAGVTLAGNKSLADLGIAPASSIPDVSGKADKVSGATNNNFAALDANGNLKDSGHKHSDYLTSHQDISGKADKVNGAVEGNFAALNVNGNLIDSGKKASDFGTYSKPSGGIPASDLASAVQTSLNSANSAYQKPSAGIPPSDMTSEVQTSLGKANSAYQKPSGGIPASDIADGVIPDVTGKADKVSGATNNNFASLDANGNLKDSGHKHSDYLTSHQDISGKADKVIGATEGNFVALDLTGNIVDSGIGPGSMAGIDDSAGIGDTDKTWSADKLTKEFGDKADAIKVTASGNIVTINDGADSMPMDVEVQIAPVQSGTGDPSPENVRPITGWTGANVYRTGKNLIDSNISIINRYITEHQWLYSADSKSVAIPVKPNTKYVLSGYPNDMTIYRVGTIRIDALPSDNSAVDLYQAERYTTYVGFGDPKVITTDSYAKWLVIQFNYDKMATALETLQLEFGETPSSYTPGTLNTYPVTWQTEAGTVYGGTYNTKTGKLIATKKIVEFDGSWGYTASSTYQGSFYTKSLANYEQPLKKYSEGGTVICTHAKSIGKPTAQNYSKGCCGIDTYFNIWICDAGTTVQQFKDLLDEYKTNGNPLRAVFDLVTPVEYDLSAVSIISLLGVNNVWADCGNVAVEYSADTKKYVDAIANETSDLSVLADDIAPDFSSLQYPVSEGTYCIYEGVLYKAKYDISTASSWNAASWDQVTVSAGLEELKDKADNAIIADDYESSPHSFIVGEYATYKGELYRCIHATSGSWNSAYWTKVTVGDDLYGKANAADTVLYTTLSRGRHSAQTIGTGSFAFGHNVVATGAYSHAEGSGSALADYAHAEGQSYVTGDYAHGEGSGMASGAGSHAEGMSTSAEGANSHAEGSVTIAYGYNSHAEGDRTVANGTNSHVFGVNNIPDSYDNWEEWDSTKQYYAGDKVKETVDNEVGGYVALRDNINFEPYRDQERFIWYYCSGAMNYVEIVGNGFLDDDPSNARTLDWDGNEKLAGDLTVFAGTSKEISVGGLRNSIDTWELIKDVTASQDLTEIVVNTDSNGSAFKLRKLIAIFSAPVSTTGNRDAFYGTFSYIDQGDVTRSTSFPSLTYVTATSVMLARVEIEAVPNMPLMPKMCVATGDGNTQYENSMVKSATGKCITYFRIYQSASNKSLIPSGANLKIYGVRYYE